MPRLFDFSKNFCYNIYTVKKRNEEKSNEDKL